MKKTVLLSLIGVICLTMAGCGPRSSDPRVALKPEVGSDVGLDNWLLRPVGDVISAVCGDGVTVNQVIKRQTNAGFMEVVVKGYNKNPGVKQFQYKIIWLDSDGAVIDSITDNWMPCSANGHSNYTIKAVATRKAAVDFRMDTRKHF